MTKKTVLLVEDDADQRFVLATLLEAGAFDVIQACDGEDALNKIANNQVDIVVSDLAMPKLNGAELAASLNEKPKTSKLPIILITAGEDIVPLSDVKFKADDFCLKKNISDLIGKVETVLEYRN